MIKFRQKKKEILVLAVAQNPPFNAYKASAIPATLVKAPPGEGRRLPRIVTIIPLSHMGYAACDTLPSRA